jgi:hexulose-6-phosphate isomerase
MRQIGIMQGRLLPPIEGRIQAFPGRAWQEEFGHCQALGLTCLEWIFELRAVEQNPLCTDDGIAEIRALSTQHNVHVGSVVADYFMERLLFGEDRTGVQNACAKLAFLIEQCAKCGIPLVELPFVDNSSLRREGAAQDVQRNLREALALADQRGVKIGFETDLPPEAFAAFLDGFEPHRVYANYDMGNSAALGFDATEEIALLGSRIANVHIKDRVRGGGTVPLGEGDTDFAAVFAALAGCGYSGELILQAAREDLGADSDRSPLETVRAYLEFTRDRIAAAAYS